jgi:hypothetical protein
MQIIRFVIILFGFLITSILTLPLLFITVPFWLISGTSKLVGSVLKPKTVEWSDIIEYDEYVGWKPKPNVDTYYHDLSEQHCHIITGPDGWPGEVSFDDADVVVFGDSFAYGFGIDHKKSYARIIDSPRIKPIGAPGYNMVQIVLLMKHYVEKLKGKIVVWFICLENDLYDNIKPYNSSYTRTPYVSRRNGKKDWEIITEHISHSPWFVASRRRLYYNAFAQFCTASPLSDYAYSAAEYLIVEAQKVLDSVNAKLVVFTVPQREQLFDEGIQELISYLPNQMNGFDPDFPDKKFNNICRNAGAYFIAGKSFLNKSDYLPIDPHWNQKGNKKVARTIAEYYSKLQ